MKQWKSQAGSIEIMNKYDILTNKHTFNALHCWKYGRDSCSPNDDGNVSLADDQCERGSVAVCRLLLSSSDLDWLTTRAAA